MSSISCVQSTPSDITDRMLGKASEGVGVYEDNVLVGAGGKI